VNPYSRIYWITLDWRGTLDQNGESVFNNVRVVVPWDPARAFADLFFGFFQMLNRDCFGTPRHKCAQRSSLACLDHRTSERFLFLSPLQWSEVNADQ
jgi:hypothetical protein